MRQWLHRHGRALVRPVCGALVGVSLGAALLQGALAVDLNGPALLLTLCAVLGLIVVLGAGQDAAPPAMSGFGLANGITLTRGVLVALLAGLIGSPLADQTAWLATGLALACLVLDGFDGWVARRWGSSSEFGARFDMESDAILMLVLCLILIGADKAPAWAICLGLMRYGFILAGRLSPALRAPLPPRFRRKAICVLQGATLTLCLTPLLAAPASTALLLLTLAALVLSFGTDMVWLLARQRDGQGGPLAPKGRHVR